MILCIWASKFSSTTGGRIFGISLAIAGHLGAGGVGVTGGDLFGVTVVGIVVVVFAATMKPERDSGNLIQNQDFAKQANFHWSSGARCYHGRARNSAYIGATRCGWGDTGTN